jgi:RNA polymerase sigma-70 factor (ECF subfamily)
VYVDAVFSLLYSMESDREKVMDWVQQAFIKAFLKLDQFNGESTFKTWLMKIAINEMNMERRKTMYKLELSECNDSDLQAIPSDHTEYEDWSYVRTHINRLSGTKRLVFTLYEVEGYSHAEIAHLLDISEANSKALLSRGKKQLRKWIRQEIA